MEYQYSIGLSEKIGMIKKVNQKIQLGTVAFDNPLLLAPMSKITMSPFRLLMQELGAGGSISELISCHGINYQNEQTHHMLWIDQREKNIGLQLFGEDPHAMALAAKKMQDQNPNFIDINMGCPVKKVVSKGGGSALLKDPNLLHSFLKTIKKNISCPLSIKIRTGWDEQNLNADQVSSIAENLGIEFISIHGRTRSQQYKGLANWDYMEKVAMQSKLPIIGNGDLICPNQIAKKMRQTNCKALMIGRGALKNPFIFLETLMLLNSPHIGNLKQAHGQKRELVFGPHDFFEVYKRLEYLFKTYPAFKERPQKILTNLRKHLLWLTSGFKNSSHIRNMTFEVSTLKGLSDLAKDFFFNQNIQAKTSIFDPLFMNSGHG